MITIRDVNTHKRTLPDLRLESAKRKKRKRSREKNETHKEFQIRRTTGPSVDDSEKKARHSANRGSIHLGTQVPLPREYPR